MWEGEIACLMAVVTSTRTEKSKAGLVPHAHMSDGRLHLVIVRKCSRLQFFRFLLGLTRKGVDESLDFVDVKEVEAWRIQPLDQGSQQSYWNVDGELMNTDYMSARVHHGLIEVFGRGPEV
jgi:ceramide kinase